MDIVKEAKYGMPFWESLTRRRHMPPGCRELVIVADTHAVANVPNATSRGSRRCWKHILLGQERLMNL